MIVEVARATRDGAATASVEVAEGATVAEAISASVFRHSAHAAVAIYGEVVAPDRPLVDGDRVELLSSLVVDPKTARLNRAADSRQSPPRSTHPRRPLPKV